MVTIFDRLRFGVSFARQISWLPVRLRLRLVRPHPQVGVAAHGFLRASEDNYIAVVGQTCAISATMTQETRTHIVHDRAGPHLIGSAAAFRLDAHRSDCEPRAKCRREYRNAIP